jgi:hypothetical protein
VWLHSSSLVSEIFEMSFWEEFSVLDGVNFSLGWCVVGEICIRFQFLG